MKKLIVVFCLLFGFVSTKAQNSKGSEQTKQLKWYTDVKEAITISSQKQKPLLLFFTGSDWCGWCIRLQKEVLTTPEFTKWADENVVLVELDYPRRTPQSIEIKSQNNELQQAFGIKGFPTIYFANAESIDGRINFKGLGSTGYVAGGPANWLATANTILMKK